MKITFVSHACIKYQTKNLIFEIGYHIDRDNRSKELKLRPYHQNK